MQAPGFQEQECCEETDHGAQQRLQKWQIAIGTRFQAGEASLPFGAERKAAIDQIPQRRSDDTHNENNDQSKESRPQQEMKPAGDAQRPYDIHGEYVSDR